MGDLSPTGFAGMGAMGGAMAAQQEQIARQELAVKAGELGFKMQDIDVRRQAARQKLLDDTATATLEGYKDWEARITEQVRKGGPIPLSNTAFWNTVQDFAARADKAQTLRGAPEGTILSRFNALRSLASGEIGNPAEIQQFAPGSVGARPNAGGGVDKVIEVPPTPPAINRTDVNMVNESAAEKALGEAQGGIAADLVKGRQDAQGVRDLISGARAMADKFKEAGGTFGPLANTKILAGNIAQAAGFKPEAFGLASDRSAGESLQGLSNDLVLGKLGGKLGAQISDADRQFLEVTVPRIENSERGFNLKLELADRIQRRKQEAADRFDEARARGLSIEKANQEVSKWTRATPLFSEKQRTAIASMAPEQSKGTKDFSKMSIDDLMSTDISQLSAKEKIAFNKALRAAAQGGGK